MAGLVGQLAQPAAGIDFVNQFCVFREWGLAQTTQEAKKEPCTPAIAREERGLLQLQRQEDISASWAPERETSSPICRKGMRHRRNFSRWL
jgi:hypothetical protein